MEKEAKDKLVEKVDNYSKNKKMVKLYSKYTRQELEHNTLIREAEIRGINQGIDKRNVEIAKNLLNMNMSLEDISTATGLSIEEVKEIQN